WLKNTNILSTENNIRKNLFRRVPFGVISSPFLLPAALDFHLKSYKSATAYKIRENIYVDNVITDAESTQDAVQFYEESKQIFTKTGMNLRDWASNDEVVVAEIPSHDRSLGHKLKALGLTWTMKDDQLSIN
ncbi:MAG: hypothetical protein AB2693_29305, partial [Candidatus Thiodiazotropha sp.]